ARMKYEPKAKFSTWLYRIAVNHCLNEIRARKSQPSLAAPINDMLEEPEGENPDARMSRVELQQAVKAAIDALPENQRMAVILARYEDMSYDQIAETMGMSLEAVKSVLFRAKENLKQALSKYARVVLTPRAFLTRPGRTATIRGPNEVFHSPQPAADGLP